MHSGSTLLKRVLSAMALLALPFAATLQATDSAVANAHLRQGDYTAAYQEFRALAEVGYPVYQNQVAAMHAYGVGVAMDKMLAHVWYTLSASQGNSDAIRARGLLELELSSEQLARSRELAPRYAAKYVAPFRPPSWQMDPPDINHR